MVEDEGPDADIDADTGTEEWGEEDILYLETDEEEAMDFEDFEDFEELE